MQGLFGGQIYSRFSALFLLVTTISILTGCGAGTPDAPGSTSGSNVPSLSITLTNGGAPVTTVPSGTTAAVKATLKDATGAAVAGAVVTFVSADASMGIVNPSSGTALTDAAGAATIMLTGGTTAGASTITANAKVGTSTVTGSIGYAVGPASLTISTPVFGVGVTPLSAFGTTSVAVTVSSGGVPVTAAQTVTFSSPCASSGKAVLSASVATVNGIATGSYRDNGCAGTDSVTASVGGTTTSSATLTVIAPTTGSIQYVSSTPTNISLKGTGNKETAQVVFKVLDSSGNPLNGKLVTFGLSTIAGGIILTPNTGVAPYGTGTATSDANGLVMTTVNAGTMSTPVRVTASTCTDVSLNCTTGVTLTTQSSQLTITTGIPDQYGFSLSASAHNIEGWTVDGTTSVLTARLADHFKNPVPDGTAVVFTSEASSVVSNCTTTNGACNVTFTSQGTRPYNGRVTVLAYAVGEETFTDLSANGWADLSPQNEMIDPNGGATDLPEAWVDYDEDGIFDPATEPFIDFNSDGIYNLADGKFSGALCDDVNSNRSSAGTCSTTHTLHVRTSQQIVLSSSQPRVTINGGVPLALTTCASGGAPEAITVTVVDLNGNAMPVGTTIAISTDYGSITSAASFIQVDTIGCRTGFPGCPALVRSATFGDIPVIIKPACTASSGLFTVKVTSPKGLITTVFTGITD